MKNLIKRATLLAKGDLISEADLGPSLQQAPQPESMALHSEADEAGRIRRALQAAGGNKSQAARLLGVDRKTLYNKMKLYGL